LVDELFISDYKMRLPMFIDWNSLTKNIQNRCFDLSLLDKDIFHYSASLLEKKHYENSVFIKKLFQSGQVKSFMLMQDVFVIQGELT